MPPPPPQRGPVRPRRRRPARRVPTHRRRAPRAVRHGQTGRSGPRSRTSSGPTGTAGGTWSPSPSPSHGGRPATPSATAWALLGGAPIHNGLYVSPPDGEGRRRRRGRPRRGRARHPGDDRPARRRGRERSPRRGPPRLWRLDDLASRYAAFVERWSGVLDNLRTMQREHTPLPDTAFLPGALAMALAYRACFDADPLLPAELLPRPWPGRAAPRPAGRAAGAWRCRSGPTAAAPPSSPPTTSSSTDPVHGGDEGGSP